MQFQYMHNELKDKNEIVIAERYSNNARHYITALTNKTIISTFL